MAYYENISLEKGMYTTPGKSFSQVLEELDSSENYRGTPMEGLDAYQRQLKRFAIKVSGPESGRVESFFQSTQSAALFGICGPGGEAGHGERHKGRGPGGDGHQNRRHGL